jgi:uncharacterized damage-inducible protein DinB
VITPAYVQGFARYNQWQNRSLYREAGLLDDAARKRDRGAFFDSIHGTLCHLFWGDTIWMSRFVDWPTPDVAGSDSSTWFNDWDSMAAARVTFDAKLIDWAESVEQGWLESEMTWTSSINPEEQSGGVAKLLVHFFNHQTHHRGQVHAMLTGAGRAPDDTDIIFMPKDM